MSPLASTTRPYSRTATMVAAAATPKFAEGSDGALLAKAVDGLVSRNWAVTANGQGLERTFRFKTFAKTWVS